MSYWNVRCNANDLNIKAYRAIGYWCVSKGLSGWNPSFTYRFFQNMFNICRSVSEINSFLAYRKTVRTISNTCNKAGSSQLLCEHYVSCLIPRNLFMSQPICEQRNRRAHALANLFTQDLTIAHPRRKCRSFAKVPRNCASVPSPRALSRKR